jgi:hypothetical protein
MQEKKGRVSEFQRTKGRQKNLVRPSESINCWAPSTSSLWTLTNRKGAQTEEHEASKASEDP